MGSAHRPRSVVSQPPIGLLWQVPCPGAATLIPRPTGEDVPIARYLQHGGRHVVTAVRVRLCAATLSGYARLRTARSEGGARLRTVEQHFNRAHKWAEMLRHPCILGDKKKQK